MRFRPLGIPMALLLALGSAYGAPVTTEEARTPAPLLEPSAPLNDPIDLSAWVSHEQTDTLFAQQIEQGRAALVQQPFAPRPPTWIQSAAVVNLGDFPGLDDITERSERELRTLEWVLTEQDRQTKPRGPAGEVDDAGSDGWIRALLPRHWMPLVKAHREWLLAGVGLALVAAALVTTLVRRPGQRPSTHDDVGRLHSTFAPSTQAGPASSSFGNVPPVRSRPRRSRTHRV